MTATTMNDDLKSKLFLFITRITLTRWLITMLVAISAIVLYSVYENRQQMFEMAQGTIKSYAYDFKIDTPNKQQHAIVNNFLALHPEVAFVSLIDADPLTNTRSVVHRFTKDLGIEKFFTEMDKTQPGLGNGPLFTNKEDSNAQVIAVANGEFMCSPVKNSILERAYPIIAKDVIRTCRVPLPPAFRKAGGWFAIHLKSNVDEALFKTDALTMSFQYSEADK